MSRQQRPRQIDYSKPLAKIDNVDAFVNLEPNVEGYNKVLEILKAFSTKEKIKKIPVPINENDKKPADKVIETNGDAEKPCPQLQISQQAKKKKTQTDYIRVLERETLPRNDIYEATYEDIQFIQNKLIKKVKLDENGSSSSQKLSTPIFEQIILA